MTFSPPNILLVFYLLLTVSFGIASCFLVFLGRKYLYNLSYFGEPVILDGDKNLIPEITYEPSDYEDVPEPYKLQIPIYFVLFVTTLNLLGYLFGFLFQFFFNRPLGLFNIIMHDTPLFNVNIIILQALFFYSFNMHIQVKQYKNYYTQLIGADESNELDLINELHEK